MSNICKEVKYTKRVSHTLLIPGQLPSRTQAGAHPKWVESEVMLHTGQQLMQGETAAECRVPSLALQRVLVQEPVDWLHVGSAVAWRALQEQVETAHHLQRYLSECHAQLRSLIRCVHVICTYSSPKLYNSILLLCWLGSRMLLLNVKSLTCGIISELNGGGSLLILKANGFTINCLCHTVVCKPGSLWRSAQTVTAGLVPPGAPESPLDDSEQTQGGPDRPSSAEPRKQSVSNDRELS